MRCGGERRGAPDSRALTALLSGARPAAAPPADKQRKRLETTLRQYMGGSMPELELPQVRRRRNWRPPTALLALPRVLALAHR